MSPNYEISTQKPSLETRFANKFVKSLLRIKRRRPRSRTLSSSISKKKIKMASYSSMALAVGFQRVWSRSVIFKNRYTCRRREKVVKVRKERSQFDMLRELVPGGEKMDLCKLLEEAAHYVKCLGVQVKVMETIVDVFSTPKL